MVFIINVKFFRLFLIIWVIVQNVVVTESGILGIIDFVSLTVGKFLDESVSNQLFGFVVKQLVALGLGNIGRNDWFRGILVERVKFILLNVARRQD